MDWKMKVGNFIISSRQNCQVFSLFQGGRRKKVEVEKSPGDISSLFPVLIFYVFLCYNTKKYSCWLYLPLEASHSLQGQILYESTNYMNTQWQYCVVLKPCDKTDRQLMVSGSTGQVLKLCNLFYDLGFFFTYLQSKTNSFQGVLESRVDSTSQMRFCAL